MQHTSVDDIIVKTISKYFLVASNRPCSTNEFQKYTAPMNRATERANMTRMAIIRTLRWNMNEPL